MEGKVAIVTGGAGGIGSAVCRAFAGAGVGVAVADMDATRADDTAANVSSQGGRAIGIEVEVTCEASVEAAVQRTVEHFGRVDFLVHCAGNNIRAPVLELAAEDWSRASEHAPDRGFPVQQGRRQEASGPGQRRPRSFHVVGRRKSAGAGARGLHSGKGGPDRAGRRAVRSSGPNTA